MGTYSYMPWCGSEHYGIWHMCRNGLRVPLSMPLRTTGMCKLSVSGTTCAPPARRKGVTPRKRRGHNQKSAGMQKISRSRCGTKSQDGTAERGSALFVVWRTNVPPLQWRLTHHQEILTSYSPTFMGWVAAS